MFSSNQVLEISGDLSHKGALKNALEFALKASENYGYFLGYKPCKCAFQITERGDYCIGWVDHKDVKKGWTKFQFDFDIEIIAAIIEQHLSKQKTQEYGGDGADSRGFLMQNINHRTMGVENPSHGIVIFSAFNCYYAK